jgi:hypothetical protein
MRYHQQEAAQARMCPLLASSGPVYAWMAGGLRIHADTVAGCWSCMHMGWTSGSTALAVLQRHHTQSSYCQSTPLAPPRTLLPFHFNL